MVIETGLSPADFLQATRQQRTTSKSSPQSSVDAREKIGVSGIYGGVPEGIPTRLNSLFESFCGTSTGGSGFHFIPNADGTRSINLISRAASLQEHAKLEQQAHAFLMLMAGFSSDASARLKFDNNGYPLFCTKASNQQLAIGIQKLSAALTRGQESSAQVG